MSQALKGTSLKWELSDLMEKKEAASGKFSLQAAQWLLGLNQWNVKFNTL